MGCEVGQDVERPVHRVWVDAFELAATQVTNAEYDVFLRDTGRQPPPYWDKPGFNRPDHPVVAVSWFEATAYCKWLSSETGTEYRLPTEAEWERAARGGVEQHLYPWGNEPPQSRPGYGERWQQGPDPVRQSPPQWFWSLRNVRRPRGAATGFRLITERRRNEARAVRKQATQVFPRRIVASPHQDFALLGALQHSPAVSVCGLRVPGSARRSQ